MCFVTCRGGQTKPDRRFPTGGTEPEPEPDDGSGLKSGYGYGYGPVTVQKVSNRNRRLTADSEPPVNREYVAVRR